MSIVEIHMPEEQEGTEAAIAAWLKRPGDPVNEHEPVLEISTDKVTLEIPSPGSGTLRTQSRQVGDGVAPGDLLGTIETDAAGIATDEPPATAATVPRPASAAKSVLQPVNPAPDAEQETTFSPVVRRLLAELGLDPRQVAKVTRGGRITPNDIAAHLSAAIAEPRTKPVAASPLAASTRPGRRIPHTTMRRSIATHMARSVQTAPHVTAVFEADLFHVVADRERCKSAGEPVASITAYIVHAAVQAIRQFPEVNSRWHDDYIEIFDPINFGVGAAIDSGGLVVPVLRDAEKMDLPSLSNRLRELTLKARAGKLTHADMAGGTFTLSNHGVSGSLMAAPIVLPHGQAAILGTGKLQRRVVVCETGGRELFRVRPMMYVTLTVDHRVLDGQQTNGFLARLVEILESKNFWNLSSAGLDRAETEAARS